MVYPIIKIIIPLVYKLWLRKVEGAENIPKDGSFIIVGNHASYFDSFIFPSIIIPKLNKRMCALIDSTYWKYPLIKHFLDKRGGIPVHVNKEKDAKEKNKLSIEVAVEHLKKGEILMMFPEGGRSDDGKLGKGYNGVSKIALASKAPVVPAGIIGSHKVWPKGKYMPRFKRCEVKIGKPIYFRKYYNKNQNKKILDGVTRIIMKEIGKLIGQEYKY